MLVSNHLMIILLPSLNNLTIKEHNSYNRWMPHCFFRDIVDTTLTSIRHRAVMIVTWPLDLRDDHWVRDKATCCTAKDVPSQSIDSTNIKFSCHTHPAMTSAIGQLTHVCLTAPCLYWPFAIFVILHCCRGLEDDAIKRPFEWAHHGVMCLWLFKPTKGRTESHVSIFLLIYQTN